MFRTAALLACLAGLARGADFSSTQLYVSPQETQTVVEVQVDFVNTYGLDGSDTINILLPKFTSGDGSKTPGPNIPLGDMHISPSIYFDGQWLEGSFNSIGDPFFDSTLVLHVKPGIWLRPGMNLKVYIYATNGIRVYCGFTQMADVPAASMWTNSTNARTRAPSAPFFIEQSDSVGVGCTAQAGCQKKGDCDYCLERCECYEGHGKGDVKGDRSTDCSQFDCPVGVAWAGLPTDETHAHPTDVPCSGAGTCEAISGICECFPEFTGDACQRRICNEDCNGHGQCLAMGLVARPGVDALPLSNRTDLSYGDVETKTGRAWDWDTMQHCVCDSRWEVGLGYGQTQTPEYFGADCSRKHCPSGPLPDRSWRDDTDCVNVTAEGGRGAGEPGNICHVECSGRGSCDYEYGGCECFPGYRGFNCGTLINNAGAVT